MMCLAEQRLAFKLFHTFIKKVGKLVEWIFSKFWSAVDCFILTILFFKMFLYELWKDLWKTIKDFFFHICWTLEQLNAFNNHLVQCTFHSKKVIFYLSSIFCRWALPSAIALRKDLINMQVIGSRFWYLVLIKENLWTNCIQGSVLKS